MDVSRRLAAGDGGGQSQILCQLINLGFIKMSNRLKITGPGLERLEMTADLKKRLSLAVAGQLPAFNVVSLILEKLDSALAKALNEANRL